jgi:multidrug efflux pump subunit AcrB
VPIGFAESQAGEYTISLFQVVAIALIASWLVAVLFTPIVAGALLKPPAAGATTSPAVPAGSTRRLTARHPRALDHHRGDHRRLSRWRSSRLQLSTGSSSRRRTATS